VNRSRAERAVEESDLDQAEALLMMMLLRRAHNDTLAVPDWRTPALPQLAVAARVSESTARRRLAHLEKHGWVKRSPGDGRGRKSTYALLPEGATPGKCDCPKGVTQMEPFQAVKGVKTAPERVSNALAEPQASPGIAPRDVQGERVNKGRLPPDWLLIREIVRIVHADPCGGIHREELAERLQLPSRGRALTDALMVAYRRKQIDFCGRYVVKPAPIRSQP
jgi:DNA-binding MarR family transcriptional regulator